MALFSILVDIAAKTASFEEGMKRVEHSLDKFAEFAKTGLELAGIGIGLESIVHGLEKTFERGEQLVLLADRMHTTTESLTQLGFAAKLSGVSFESLSGAMDIMSKNIGMAAEDTGRAQKILKLLGIDAREFVSLSLDEQLGRIADKIAGLSNATEQAQVAMQIFGGEGARLLPFLREGSDGIQRMREESDKLGHTMSSLTANELRAAEEQIKKLQAAWDGLFARFASGVSLTAQDIGLIPAGELQDLDNKLKGLAQTRNELLSGARTLEGGLITDQRLQTAQAYADALANVEKEMNAINDQLNESRSNSKTPLVEVTVSPALLESYQKNKKLLDDIAKETQKRNDEVDAATAELQKQFAQRYAAMDTLTMTSVERQIAAFNDREQAIKSLLDAGLINETQAANRTAELWDETFKEVVVSARYVPEITKKTMTEVQNIGADAARGLQQDFAEFFFDPINVGFDGLLKSFVDTLRRMFANAAASDLFNLINGAVKDNSKSSSLGSLFSSFLSAFGGGKAAGGPLDQGKWYVAGEHGPEPIWGGGAGAFAGGYGGMGGGMSVVINSPVDARGATQDAVRLIPQAMKQAHDAAVSTIVDMKRRGRL